VGKYECSPYPVTIIEERFIKNSESLTLLGIVVALFGIVANHRLQLLRSRSEEYRKASLKFIESFGSAVRKIKAGESLNHIILNEYPGHEVAMLKFVENLDNKATQEFNAAWIKYKKVWEELRDMGYTAYVATILPNNGMPLTQANIEKYERERALHVLGLIEYIMNFARRKRN